MGYVNVTQGVTISVPTSGTRNWAQNLLTNAWQKLSSHDHTGSGKGLQIVTAAIANLAVTSAKLAKNLAGTQATTVVQAANAATLDFNNGNIQKLSLQGATGPVAVTLSNPQAGGVYKIFVVQDSTAVRDISWPVAVLWPQGEKYGVDVSQGTSDIDCVTLYYDGTNYFGDFQLNWS
jgi:hypothetical protein